MKHIVRFIVGYLIVNIYYVVIREKIDRMEAERKQEKLERRLKYHDQIFEALCYDQEFIDLLERRTLDRIDQAGMDLTFEKIVRRNK